MSNEEIQAPQEAKILLKRWLKLYRWWWALHYTLGLSGIVCAALVAASVGNDEFIKSDGVKTLFGVVATVTTSIVTFLGPLQKAERYYSSYHILDQACYDFRSEIITQKEFSLKKTYARSLLCSNNSGHNDVSGNA